MDRLTTYKNECNREIICRYEECDVCEEYCPHLQEDNCPCLQEALEKLGQYEDAEEQRMLLKLPCKVGDYVFQIDRMLWKIHTRKVSKIELAVTATGSVMTIYFETAGFCYSSHFGKTVFLDKKDALNALDQYSVE